MYMHVHNIYAYVLRKYVYIYTFISMSTYVCRCVCVCNILGTMYIFPKQARACRVLEEVDRDEVRSVAQNRGPGMPGMPGMPGARCPMPGARCSLAQ